MLGQEMCRQTAKDLREGGKNKVKLRKICP